MTRYFKATFADGHVEVRSSASRTYSHCVVTRCDGRGVVEASWVGRPDLVAARCAGAKAPFTAEAAEAVETTGRWYREALKERQARVAAARAKLATAYADRAIIERIADRAVALGDKHGLPMLKLHVMMDLSACHASGCALRLADLLAADDFNFSHDVLGIRRHLNRDTGLLDGGFRPRFAKREG